MTTQVTRPMSDDLTGVWTPTPLYERVNKPTPNDAAPISSGSNPAGDVCQVKLRGVAWPDLGLPAAAEVLTVRLAGDGSTPATVVLLQGNKLIASRRVVPGSAFQDCLLTLTAAEVAQISDYTDLHVEVIAGDVSVSCCPNPVPPVLLATFSNPGGGCGCLDGLQVKLLYDPANPAWVARYHGCTHASLMGMTCDAATMTWGAGSGPDAQDFDPSNCHWPSVVATSVTCSPFRATFDVTVTGCCSGTVRVTVTE